MARKSGGDKLHHKKKPKKELERKKPNREETPSIIIACEDSVSSPTYFRKIVQKLIDEKKITQDSFVIATHKHSNPIGVLKDLKNHQSLSGETYKNFKHRWIVIDRDAQMPNCNGHIKEDFNNALNQAKKDKIEVAYSNDSFELWYLLHFVYRETFIMRDEIVKTVIKELQIKNPNKFKNLDADSIKESTQVKLIYDELLELQDKAINNASKLLSSYGENHNPERDNPSTTVHKLVEILNNLA
jgi:hypothetical protein